MNESAKNAGNAQTNSASIVSPTEFDGTEHCMPLQHLGYLVGVPVRKHGEQVGIQGGEDGLREIMRMRQ